MFIIGVIAVAVFFACLLGVLFNMAVKWHDANSYRQWRSRWDGMTREERLSEMNVTVD